MLFSQPGSESSHQMAGYFNYVKLHTLTPCKNTALFYSFYNGWTICKYPLFTNIMFACFNETNTINDSIYVKLLENRLISVK